MFSNVSCCGINISGHLKHLHCWKRKCFAVIDLEGGGEGGWGRVGGSVLDLVQVDVVPLAVNFP